MPSLRFPLWRHDPSKLASGKPGAVQTAITAKMARVVHAVVKRGADYRPFLEAAVPSGRTSLGRSRRGAAATS